MRVTIRFCLPWLAAICVGASGCSALRGSSPRPTFASFRPDSIAVVHRAHGAAAGVGSYSTPPSLADLDAAYLRAEHAERLGLESCVDHYYDAALRGWQYLETAKGGAYDPCWNHAWHGYHAALARLIVAGQCFRRLDPRGRLTIHMAAGPGSIPVVHNGFPWQPCDFQSLDIATEDMSRRLRRRYRRPGIGVPVIANRFVVAGGNQSRFVRDRAAFAATVVMRAASTASRTADGDFVSPVLEIVDPLRVAHEVVGDKTLPLAGDLTAPFGIIAKEMVDTGWAGFLDPDEVPPESLGLIFLEPYQPGKIPVVFVHGLLSDPTTWLDLVNDLRGQPGVAQSYQFWAFRYATGQAFVKSALELRRDCNEALQTCDPAGRDAVLDRMVLIGHSMGGLVSKLQVTHSDLRLWSTVTPFPLHEFRMTQSTQRVVCERFFFEPQPFVERVIFIGTPHGGSSFASRFVGRFGSMLVNEPAEDSCRFQQIRCDNPGMLTPFASRGMPTSVDMLQPDNPALGAVRCLRVGANVHLHSIIGTGRTMLIGGPADGIVPVASARHPGVDSELFVDAKHSELHHHPDTVREVTRILLEHAAAPM
jgi:pimeloyl-ACP methyl ester carboxylesterase